MQSMVHGGTQLVGVVQESAPLARFSQQVLSSVTHMVPAPRISDVSCQVCIVQLRIMHVLFVHVAACASWWRWGVPFVHVAACASWWRWGVCTQYICLRWPCSKPTLLFFLAFFSTKCMVVNMCMQRNASNFDVFTWENVFLFFFRVVWMFLVSLLAQICFNASYANMEEALVAIYTENPREYMYSRFVCKHVQKIST